MRQRQTEEALEHRNDEQNAGNRKRVGTPEEGNADRFGDSRAGAENVEQAPQPERYEPRPARPH